MPNLLLLDLNILSREIAWVIRVAFLKSLFKKTIWDMFSNRLIN